MSLQDTRFCLRFPPGVLFDFVVFAFASLLEYCLILWCRGGVSSYWAYLYVDLLGLLQINILPSFADIEFTIVIWQKNYTYPQFLLSKKSENWGQIKSVQIFWRNFWNRCDLFYFLLPKNGWLVETLRAYRHVSPSNIAIRGHHQQNTRPHLCLNITWPRYNIVDAIVATLVLKAESDMENMVRVNNWVMLSIMISPVLKENIKWDESYEIFQIQEYQGNKSGGGFQILFEWFLKMWFLHQ